MSDRWSVLSVQMRWERMGLANMRLFAFEVSVWAKSECKKRAKGTFLKPHAHGTYSPFTSTSHSLP